MHKARKAEQVKLDWDRMLGFDQASRARQVGDAEAIKDPRFARLGGKISVKPGLKLPITR